MPMLSDSDEMNVGPSGGDRLDAKVPVTKSYLTNKAWVEHIKGVIEKGQRLEHERLLGPFFREDAPYRAKITPPHEDGIVLVIKGRVWAHDTKEPLGGAKMNVWQADKHGHYDNEGPKHSPEHSFINRARIYCDRHGYYEFETIHPGPYKRDGVWRAPHIHFLVEYSGYTPMVTQLFFIGDPRLDEDPFREDSLTIQLREMQRNGKKYKEGVFDIVLTAETPET
jgi:catechol 1,2-dioxygenase